MHPGPGFRVRQDIERPSKETVVGLGRFETPAEQIEPDGALRL